MEQLSRRALFGLGVGALALPAVKLLQLPTTPKPAPKIPPKTVGDYPPNWNQIFVKTYKVMVRRDNGDGIASVMYEPGLPPTDAKILHDHSRSWPIDPK